MLSYTSQQHRLQSREVNEDVGPSQHLRDDDWEVRTWELPTTYSTGSVD